MAIGPAVIRTPDQRLRVFVSSTLQELEPERAAAAEAIRGLKLTPVLFELGARPHPPRQLYRAYLEQSHVFVGIYGQQYGWIAPGMQVSGLEDEYLLSGDRPKLIYVKRPAPERDARLEALLRRIEEHDRACYKTFSSPQALGVMLSNDLAVLLSERFETAAAGAAPAAAGQPRARSWRLAAGATALALLAGFGALHLLRQRDGSTAGDVTVPVAEAASIAVLPFVNMSSDPDQEYFSDGLSDELLNMLGRLPWLRVISRTSSFRFKGETDDVRSIARVLNVAHVLEGSVRKSGNRIRVTAHLVDAESGSSVWSDSYDRDLDDIFRVQEEIARKVVQALEPALSEQSPPTVTTARDPQAYALVLQGRYFSDRRTKEDSERAVRYLEQALRLDPGFAPAWAELSRARATQAGSGFAPVEQSIALARQAAERALALDPNNATAHALIGWIELSWDWEWNEAEAHLRRALALAPGNVGVLSNAGMLARASGRLEESIQLYERAIARDPLQGLAYTSLGISLLYADRLQEAEAATRKAIDLRPEAVAQRYLLGRVLLAEGRLEPAREQFELEADEGWRLTGQALVCHALGLATEADAAVRSLTEKFSGDMPYQIAQVRAFRGEADQAFEWLERARVLRDTGLAEMLGDPLLRNIERDPRYADFLRSLKLPTGSPGGSSRVEVGGGLLDQMVDHRLEVALVAVDA